MSAMASRSKSAAVPKRNSSEGISGLRTVCV